MKHENTSQFVLPRLHVNLIYNASTKMRYTIPRVTTENEN